MPAKDKLNQVKKVKPNSLAVDNRILQQKKALLTAMADNKGIVSAACAQVGLSRATYYEYYNNDPVFKVAADDTQDIALDHVEGKLHELIDGVNVTGIGPDGITVYQKEPNVTATIFYLKTKGKKRGYVERTEQDIQVNVQMQPNDLAKQYFDYLLRQGIDRQAAIMKLRGATALEVDGEVLNDVADELEKQ